MVDEIRRLKARKEEKQKLKQLAGNRVWTS